MHNTAHLEKHFCNALLKENNGNIFFSQGLRPKDEAHGAIFLPLEYSETQLAHTTKTKEQRDPAQIPSCHTLLCKETDNSFFLS